MLMVVPSGRDVNPEAFMYICIFAIDAEANAVCDTIVSGVCVAPSEFAPVNSPIKRDPLRAIRIDVLPNKDRKCVAYSALTSDDEYT